MAIRTKHRTLTKEEIYVLYTTNLIALAAPAAGYVNRILGVTHKVVFGGTQYFSPINIYYGETSGGISFVFYDDFSTANSDDHNRPLEKSATMSPIFSTVNDFVISASGLTSLGNSAIQSYLTYETILLDT